MRSEALDSQPRADHVGDVRHVRPGEEFGVSFQSEEKPLDDFRTRSVMM